MKFLYPVAILIAVVLSIAVVTNAEPLTLWMYSTDIQMHFNNWDDDPYVASIHDCSDMSREVEEYVETQLNLSCFFVYGYREDSNGHSSAHIWNMIEINNKFYEFESTSLVFKDVSEEYKIQTMQEGFYVDGVKYEKSQPCDNWEDRFEGVLSI